MIAAAPAASISLQAFDAADMNAAEAVCMAMLLSVLLRADEVIG